MRTRVPFIPRMNATRVLWVRKPAPSGVPLLAPRLDRGRLGPIACILVFILLASLPGLVAGAPGDAIPAIMPRDQPPALVGVETCSRLVATHPKGIQAFTPTGQGLSEPLTTNADVTDGRYIYIFGGSGQLLPSSRIYRYDPLTGESITMRAALPTVTSGAVALWIDGHAYIFGGKDRTRQLQQILRYDPVSDTLETMNATLPTGRYSTSAVWTGKVAFIFTGYDSGGYRNDILSYDPITDTITRMNATFPTGLAGTVAFWSGERAYIFGGHAADIQAGIHIYDPTTDTLIASSARLPTPRYSPALAWDGETAYLFGGADSYSSQVTDILAFDPATDSIRWVATALPRPWSHGAAVAVGDEIFLLGGVAEDDRLADISIFTPGERLTWTAADLPSWADLDPETGDLCGNPESTDLGSYTFTVMVTDEDDDQDSTELSWSVSYRQASASSIFGSILVGVGGAGTISGNDTAGGPGPGSGLIDLGRSSNYTLVGDGSIGWVNVSFNYDPGSLPAGFVEEELGIYLFDRVTGRWVRLPASGVDTDSHQVWTNGTSLGEFALSGPVPTDAALLPPAVLIPIGVGGLIAGGILVLLLARVEWLVYLLALLVGSFIFRGRKQTEPEGRANILKIIFGRPGVHFRWIKTNSGFSNGTTAYHLSKLEKAGEIFSRRDGIFKRFYPTDTDRIPPDVMVQVSLRRKVLDAIEANPGSTITEIGCLLDETRQKVNYHVNVLREAGLVRLERDEGNHRIIFVNDDEGMTGPCP